MKEPGLTKKQGKRKKGLSVVTINIGLNKEKICSK
jgi:hypothetical protein